MSISNQNDPPPELVQDDDLFLVPADGDDFVVSEGELTEIVLSAFRESGLDLPNPSV